LREIQRYRNWVAACETKDRLLRRRDWGLEEIQRHHNWVAACETMDPRLVKMEETVQELEWHYQAVNGNIQKVVGLMHERILRVSMSCSQV
jgi:hypothetical protein